MKRTCIAILLATCIAGALCQAPAAEAQGFTTLFSKRNQGPPDTFGAWFQEAGPSTYLQHNNGYVTGAVVEGQLIAFLGKYTSYECDPANGPGAYKASVVEREISPDGREVMRDLCEVGKVDLKAGTYKWAADTSRCPTSYNNTVKLIPSSLSNNSKKQVC